jgi:nucleoside 2-deoxyribosyltransferase
MQAEPTRPAQPRRIYFSCSLTGGRQDQPAYAALVKHLQECGHTVLTAHLAAADVMTADSVHDPVTVYERDTAWLRACEVVIAEVSTPSHGVGFEIAYALERNKPVLCLAHAGARVSKMLTGNRTPGLEVATYGSQAEAVRLMEAFLEARVPV